MQDNFARSLKLVLKHEGGYVNHPRDPGGATNKGVIQKTYDGWRAKWGLKRQSVKLITDDEVAAIYKQEYWDAVKGDGLPDGIDFAMFDFAVNSGPLRAIRFLQTVTGQIIDGKLGPSTLAAAHKLPPTTIIQSLCAKRMTFLRNLPHWDTFGRGWAKRVTDVQRTALEMQKQAVMQRAARNSIKPKVDIPITIMEPAPFAVPEPKPVPANPGWFARLVRFFKGN